ncbi:MAG TPA: hypothetical protein VMR76_03740, partial [Candidatus Saccharimonadia bacterium]|nr:hypothetical protein [Candidatus Saccharimonadia bacterium]
MNKTLTTRASRLITVVIAFILVVLPFHEFLTTWLGSNFGHLDLFRVWKEIVLVLLIFPTSYLVLKKKQLLSFLIRDKLTILIVIFGIICLVIGIWGYETKSVNAAALSAGLIIDLRFFLIFLICLVITCYNDFFKKYWKQLLLIPALLVIVFGIAQIFLPLNFLSHFGYGANTIPAYQTIDQNLRFHRIQSTLRGADPLGAYLILIAPVPLFFITKRLWQRITII